MKLFHKLTSSRLNEPPCRAVALDASVGCRSFDGLRYTRYLLNRSVVDHCVECRVQIGVACEVGRDILPVFVLMSGQPALATLVGVP